jgi:hypothetical protein
MSAISLELVVALNVALGTAIACSSQGPSLPACTGAVTVAATAGTKPKFTWTPACQLEGLVVALPGPGAIVWSVASPSQANSIAPGVTYGVTPGGASLVTAATPLSAGTSYTVTVFWFDDGHGGSVQSAGSLTFVP